MEVHIHPPDPVDPGQLVLIWQKVTALVDLIIPRTRPNIELVPKGSWHSTEPPAHWRAATDLFYEMGSLQESIKPFYNYRPDYDIVMLPFLRLELWDEDPAKNVPAMSDAQFESFHRRLMRLFNPTGIDLRLEELHSMSQDTAARQIEDILIETNIFLDRRLDEIPGRTADFLRLNRYKHWFQDGESWESPYGCQILDQFHTSPWVVANIDPWFNHTNRRYIILIILHHTMSVLKTSSKDGRGIYKKAVYATWDSRMWSNSFPTGIPSLSDVQEWLWRFWSDESQYRIFHAYSDWLNRRGVCENGVEESRCPTLARLTLWGH
ncbi:hypothetical protein N7491_005883 [Penicillium cf. griseofulvum]|uniref:Uncharacterized protein n=1 Tax=Penicillium cf. griseofulvum TaxID=2972120 RepID=A0A9W9J2S3_9EURO|nr:hypothetical protein N7472_008567 [Penicillium cf. griseofulvum]KAJ5435288.1 hypothetical protein N7491_005883 [Penicillium cf. griseofulvum]KAJ5453121.1 hypothetical protein N7445_001304 [Penicillium cf. griseofulvum]